MGYLVNKNYLLLTTDELEYLNDIFSSLNEVLLSGSSILTNVFLVLEYNTHILFH